MKNLLFIAASLALAAARPELYREQEDFNYARSSSDDGSKSGFYGAQRGNMGGNYEKAHNMDALAQNQMSGLVKQVEGDLGDGSNTRTGSVFTSANSRGIYGSGKYDLSNLEGRNFQEGVSSGDSQSHSALSSHNSAYSGQSSSAAHRSGYSQIHSADARYHSAKTSNQALHSSNLQAVDNAQYSAGMYDYGRQAGYNSGYHSQSGYHDLNTNANQHSSNDYGSNAHTRLISGAPARVVLRPGATVIVPVAAQTFDSTHRASSYDQNAINSEAEVLSNTNQHTNYRPSSDAKHYESSYSYRKQWEKHDTHPSVVPLAVPTESPYPTNSELYDDTQASHLSSGQYQASGLDSHSAHSSNVYNRHNSNVKAASASQSRYQSGYDSQHSALAGSNSNTFTGSNANAYTGSNSNAYTHGAVADATNLVGDVNSKPKSYQSSYSYHKSWERQGDPYVIVPDSSSINNGQTSQRLTAESGRHGYDSHQYGSHYAQSHQGHSHGSNVDCDENGHIRVARSYKFDQENSDQQAQNLEDVGQQTQDLRDLGQQRQNNWDQQSSYEKLEDLGQQAQTNWNPQSSFEKLEDLGQQTQTNWLQQHGSQNLEDLGQQSENNWSQQTNFQNLGDLEQQTQTNWKQNGFQNLENLDQQAQSQWGKLEEDQQTQNGWDQTQTDLNQQTQGTWQTADNLEKLEDLGQQSQSPWNKLEDMGQKVQGPWDISQDQKLQNDRNEQQTSFSQQENQSRNNTLQSFNQYSQTFQKEQKNNPSNIWDRLDDFESQNTDQLTQQNTDNFNQQNNENQISQSQGEHLSQQTHNTLSKIDILNQYNESQNTDQLTQQNTNNFDQQNNWNQFFQDQDEELGQKTQDTWGKIDILNQDKRGNISDQVKPVWEQSEDNIEQVSDTNSQVSSSNGFRRPWNSVNDQTQQNFDSDQQTQTNYENQNGYSSSSNFSSNSNSQTNTGSGSIQSLWDKINNLEQVHSISKNNDDMNKTYFSNGESNSYSYNNNWSETNNFESDSSFTQSSHQNNQSSWHYNGHQPWQPSILVDVTSTSTTVKPKDYLERTYSVEKVRPEDIGRGDIGPEESSLPVSITTEKSYSNSDNVPYAPKLTPESNNKQYKTPEEIEVLSLTKENNKTTNFDNTKLNKHETNEDQNLQTSDDNLNVLNLNQQKWLQEERQHETNQYTDYVFSSSNATHNQNHKETQHSDGHNVSESSFNFSQPTNQTTGNSAKPVSDSQDNQAFEQSVVEIEQQNMEQQFEDLGYFGQQSKDLDQQSQTAWEQNVFDLGQQTQSAWEPQEALQQQLQSDGQEFENFGKSNLEQYQPDEFYKQKYVNNVEVGRNQKTEDLQIIPETNQRVESIQSSPEIKPESEVLSPPELTTEKPGFWKSVGSKFSSAKDTVTSWFKRS